MKDKTLKEMHAYSFEFASIDIKNSSHIKSIYKSIKYIEGFAIKHNLEVNCYLKGGDITEVILVLTDKDKKIAVFNTQKLLYRAGYISQNKEQVYDKFLHSICVELANF